MMATKRKLTRSSWTAKRARIEEEATEEVGSSASNVEEAPADDKMNKPPRIYKEWELPYQNSIGTETVALLVGTNPTITFEVSKADLSRKIPYFNRLFKSNFKESLENKVEFPEDDPRAFDLLLEWVRKDRVRLINQGPCGCVHGKECRSNRHERYSPLVFYTLADYFCLSQLQDEIMDEIRRFHREVRSMTKRLEMEKILRGSERSQLWKYQVELLAWFIRDLRWKSLEGIRNNVTDVLQGTSRVAAMAVLNRIHNPGRIADPRQSAPCEFHHHEKNAECELDQQLQRFVELGFLEPQ
jgi:hypothetical protein